MRGTKCRACGEPIAFVVMAASGNRLPVDPTPDRRGNVIAKRVRGRYVLGGHRAPNHPTPDGHVRLMPHYATCSAGRRRGPKTTDLSPSSAALAPAPAPALF